MVYGNMSIVASEWRLAHKTGQLQSMQRVSWILCVILLATIFYATHGQRALDSISPTKVDRVLAYINRLSNQPNAEHRLRATLQSAGSQRESALGWFENIHIISNTSAPAFHRPNVPLDANSLAPIANPNIHDPHWQLVASDYYEYEDPLPPQLKIPVYHTSPLHATANTTNNLRHPARLVMPDIKWPDDIHLPLSDTPSVSGLITLHADGRVTFIMNKQSHPGLSFDIAVHHAIQKATCNPAINYRGVFISVVTPYRVIFRRANASINSTRAVLGSIYDDFH